MDDTTAGLTRSGVVTLQLPAQRVLHAPTNDVRIDPDAGVGDRPPRLDDETMARRLLAWLRLRPAPVIERVERAPTFSSSGGTGVTLQGSSAAEVVPTGSSPVEQWRIDWLGVNAVEIEQWTTRTQVVIGEGNGQADQEFALPDRSVEPDTLVVQVATEGRTEDWFRVDDLGTVDRDPLLAREARVFQLDAEAGTIRFGDGVRGRIPPSGSRVMVRQMRSGGGVAGNLPAGTLKAIQATSAESASVSRILLVEQPLPLSGGVEAETLAEAERRLPARLRHRERAVTAEDYKQVARETPGIAIGRVELLPRFKPQQRHDDVPGVVTLMALPDRSLSRAPNPRADRPFLETIHTWVDARRPLGVEFYVIGCEYVPVAATVAVSLVAGAPHETTLQAIKQALVRVLWPLTGGGFDANGWGVARELSNRELAVEVARVKGVSEVAGLNLFILNVDTDAWTPLGDARDGREQNLGMARWQFPELRGVTVVVADAAPMSLDLSDLFGGGQGSATNPFADASSRPLTVPVVPEHC